MKLPRIQIVTNDLESEYRNFCTDTDGVSIYYVWEFRNLLIDLLDCEPHYLAAVDEKNKVQGILPLMMKDGPFGIVINSLPFFGSTGGVVADNREAASRLWEEYGKLIDNEEVAAATLIGNPLVSDEPPSRFRIGDTRIGQISRLDFGASPEEKLREIIAPAARRNLNKAIDCGITVSVEDNTLGALAEIHAENMEAIGGRKKPERFFSLIPIHFTSGRDYNVYVARREGRVIAALLLFYAGKTVDYYIPVTRLSERQYQPSAMMLFCSMVDAYNSGYHIWNWGGTWLSQSGVARFKRKWGAIDRNYSYYTTVKRADIYHQTQETLLDAYDHFYVVPFDQLRDKK